VRFRHGAKETDLREGWKQKAKIYCFREKIGGTVNERTTSRRGSLGGLRKVMQSKEKRTGETFEANCEGTTVDLPKKSGHSRVPKRRTLGRRKLLTAGVIGGKKGTD